MWFPSFLGNFHYSLPFDTQICIFFFSSRYGAISLCSFGLDLTAVKDAVGGLGLARAGTGSFELAEHVA